jgi:predicted RNA-binding protein with EMAP domain
VLRFVARAAKSLGVSFQAVYKRMSENQEIKEAHDEIRESYLDMAEWALISKIKDRVQQNPELIDVIKEGLENILDKMDELRHAIDSLE